MTFLGFRLGRLSRRPLRAAMAAVMAMAMSAGILAPQRPARAEETTLQVAYIPILAMAQLFIMEQEGWTKQAGLKLEMTRFSSGPAIVQALASGKFDVAYVGMGPAMVARANGVDLKALAANGLGQGGVLGRGLFAETFAKASSPAAAFAEFHKQQGRPVKLATLPKGSVPDTTLRYYLFEVAHVAPDDVQILGMGAEQMQQALLAGGVDGSSVLDPIPAIVQSKDKTARIIVAGQSMLPDAAGAVISAREKTIAAHPDAIRRLVALHIRATEFIRKNPAKAAKDITEAIGNGLVPVGVIEASLNASLDTFIADPHRIVVPTRKLQDYQIKLGVQAKPLDIEQLIDTHIYDEAIKTQ